MLHELENKLEVQITISVVIMIEDEIVLWKLNIQVLRFHIHLLPFIIIWVQFSNIT